MPPVSSIASSSLATPGTSASAFNLNLPTPEVSPSNKIFQTTLLNCPNNYSPSADLISLFDDENYKNSTDLCPYTDFLPYNALLTQALLSCNETNMSLNCNSPSDPALQLDANLCVATDNTITYQNTNQTAIDNLKALSNFQSSSTFLTNINANEAHCNMNRTNMICSAPNPNEETYNQNLDNANNIQLETDECMEIEETTDASHEELTWDSFDPYLFIKHLPPLTCEMRSKCPALPLKTRSSPEFSLVLDLDETLVHCSLQELSDASFKFPVLFQVSH